MSYLEDRMKRKNGLAPPLPTRKEKKYIPKQSEKKKAEILEQRNSGDDSSMDLFFERMRKKMVGVCQCGCGAKSQKKDDTFFRNCICHIFPKRIFKSIATNEYNWVERSFWGGCHGNMDDRSIEKWKGFADWEDIKERFFMLAPLLTEEERKKKFYTNLEKLIYG